MSARSTAQVTPGGATFKLDRFELVEDERYEVEGRWSGIRGRVFIRPELTLIDGEHSRRLLADLAQKPWQAGDGDTWTAAFPCTGDPIRVIDAELTVAPDITVPVKRGRSRRPRAATNNRAQTQPAEPVKPTATAPAGKRRGLGLQLAKAQSELEQLRADHGRMTQRLNAATRRAEEARAERDRVGEGHAELAAGHERMIRERDEARNERAQAIRDAAVDREVVERERDEAFAELERARGELAAAQQTAQKLVAERDSAIRAGVEVERELSAARAEREHLLRDRDQTLQMHRAPAPALEPSATPAFSLAADGWTDSHRPAPFSRALAVVALVTAIVVVVILLATVL